MDDPRAVTQDAGEPGTELAGSVTSVEKVLAALQLAGEFEPEPGDATSQLAAMMLTVAGPMLPRVLPEDPEELDALLLKGAMWAIGLRSDTAPALAITAAP